ncbi:MAG: 50S ribosomal protein L25 [Caldisericaceae bacterium]
MKRVELQALKREVNTKGTLNKVRTEGYVPAVVYGEKSSAVPVKIKERDLSIIMDKFGRSVLVDLNIEGTTQPTIFKEVQKSKIGKHFLHIDFEAVDLDKPVFTRIPIVAVGESKGIKEGGILEQELRELEVEGILTDLPEKVEVDITNLGIKDVVYVHNLNLSDKVRVLTRPDAVVMSIVTPTVEEVAPVTAEAAATPGAESAKVAGAAGATTGAEPKVPEAKPAKEEKK